MLDQYFYSDLARWPEYLAFFIACFTLWITAVVVHEFAHLAYFKLALKKNVSLKIQKKPLKILVGTIKDYEGMSQKQYGLLNVYGVGAGFIPILITSYFFPLLLLVCIPYVLGCRPDMQEIKKAFNIRLDYEEP